jgi:hypothetical protein
MRNLPENFVDDPEALLKNTRAKLKKALALELEHHRIRRNLIPEFKAMAQNQHNFNKMIESQLAQLAAVVPPLEKVRFRANWKI